MKIFYDPQVFTFQTYGGISRYFVEVISGVLLKGEDISLPLRSTCNSYFQKSDFLKQSLIAKNQYSKEKNNPSNSFNYKLKRRIYQKLKKYGIHDANERFCIDLLKNGDYDLVHPTYYDPYFFQYINKKPFILTIYDMTHEKFPECFGNDPTILKKKYLAEHAAAIIAISESTKADIIEILRVPPEKIHVVHLASSMEKNTKVIDNNRGIFPERYILYVGQRGHHKNFFKFVSACAPLLKASDIKIVCTASKFTTNELQHFRSLGVDGRIIHMPVSDDELSLLYSKSLAFVFPSLYEGFGIPILEAFACGCPAIISNTSCFSEVGGDAAAYFDPVNEESMRMVIEQVVSSKEIREKMIDKGYKRAALFNWDATVNKTIEVYRNVIK